ncbi:MAG: polysaccharide deacetylase family protein [Actinomycetia bacterium]|nr:polysaccharide deacetylase family protein [Actinomycetes bacterium]
MIKPTWAGAGLLALVFAATGCTAEQKPVAPTANGATTSQESESTGTQEPEAGVTPSLGVGDPKGIDWDSGRGTAASPNPDPSPSGWYPAAFGSKAKEQGKTLYLTLDDGPDAQTPAVLRLLRKHSAQATFFVVGKQAEAYPDLLGDINDQGHLIGNHSWEHADLTTLSRSAVLADLKATNRVVGTAMGGCMRPPFGAINQMVGRSAASMGLFPIMWTGQAWDWRPPASADIVADMKRATRPGAVLLLHDGGGDRSNTVSALRTLLPYWESLGYTLKGVPACE